MHLPTHPSPALNTCLHVFPFLQIGSTILAQAAGVPTLPWSGSGVAVSFADCNGVIPEDTYNKACVFSLDEAIESCQRIGYPIMLKASWGGGGKGIRKVHNDDEVRQVFKQIQGEVSNILQLVSTAAESHRIRHAGAAVVSSIGCVGMMLPVAVLVAGTRTYVLHRCCQCNTGCAC
jgi:hypothetical protein